MNDTVACGAGLSSGTRFNRARERPSSGHGEGGVQRPPHQLALVEAT